MNKQHGGESSFLSELAGEATSKLEALKSNQRDREARAALIHEALSRTFHFFDLFSRHANSLEPEIRRPYSLDNQTAFTPLKWSEAAADYRKRDLSDNAYFDHVTFRVRLASPEPVAVTRRLNQFELFKKELHVFGLRPLDDLDKLLRANTQETIQVRVAPDFLLRIRLQGNYDEDRIDMSCNNLDGFGPAMFRLAPEDITSHLLDETGRFLIGRADNLPAALHRTRHFPKQTGYQRSGQ